MRITIYKKKLLACAYFFAFPAMAYGIFTSRLPGIKINAGLTDEKVATILLGLGIATFCGLIISSHLIKRFTLKKMTFVSVLILGIGISIASGLTQLWQITALCCIAGLGVGVCDVGTNALGILLEKTSGKLSLSFLHACSGLGGIVGAITGSIFARYGVEPVWNAIAILGIYGCLSPWASNNLSSSEDQGIESKKAEIKSNWTWWLPALGVLSLLCHIIEGVTAEWGSIFLSDYKEASQSESALAFAFFTGGIVLSRLAADKIRVYIPDMILCLLSAGFGGGSMAMVLCVESSELSLIGYGLMGIALGPIVPALFSMAGRLPHISAVHASSIISIWSYSGLLLFPPLIGFIAKKAGLEATLWSVVGMCLILSALSIFLKHLPAQQASNH